MKLFLDSLGYEKTKLLLDFSRLTKQKVKVKTTIQLSETNIFWNKTNIHYF